MREGCPVLVSPVLGETGRGIAPDENSRRPVFPKSGKTKDGAPAKIGGILLYLLAVALHYVLLSDEASREAEKREVEARVLARDSELKALKTQVNPHFIIKLFEFHQRSNLK